MTINRGVWMQTYTGKAFYLLDPKPSEIDLMDIAHGLSMLCRYNGQVKKFYSVAEHSVLLSLSTPRHPAEALMHDASEAYLGDMIRPLKRAASMVPYRNAEDRVMRAIWQCFDLGERYELPNEVLANDARILVDERDQLMMPPPQPWFNNERVEPLGVRIQAWPPAEAKRQFLKRWEELF